MTTLLVGASGLVGSNLLEYLLSDNNITNVISLVRKQTNKKHPKLKEIVADFNNLDAVSSHIRADVVYCCLGTTINKAGSKEAFEQVDYHYPLALAKIAKQNNTYAFHVITALGSNSHSMIFYNKVKGKLQEALISLHFDYLAIYQPSLLLGERGESRFAEGIAQKLNPIYSKLLVGGLKKYQPIEGKQVAKAMWQYSLQPKKGTHFFTNDKLFI